MSRPDDSDLDSPIRRRTRKPSGVPLPLLVGGGVLAAVLLLGCVGGVAAWLAFGRTAGPGAGATAVAALSGPTPGREGETWDHIELFGYLHRQGVHLTGFPTKRFTAYGPAVLAGETPNGTGEIKQFMGGDDADETKDQHVVFVQKRSSAQDAKDESAVGRAHSFSWGRFLFDSADQPLLNRIRQVLMG